MLMLTKNKFNRWLDGRSLLVRVLIILGAGIGTLLVYFQVWTSVLVLVPFLGFSYLRVRWLR